MNLNCLLYLEIYWCSLCIQLNSCLHTSPGQCLPQWFAPLATHPLVLVIERNRIVMLHAEKHVNVMAKCACRVQNSRMLPSCGYTQWLHNTFNLNPGHERQFSKVNYFHLAFKHTSSIHQKCMFAICIHTYLIGWQYLMSCLCTYFSCHKRKP